VPWAETVRVAPDALQKLPECRDPDDQVFLQLAAAGSAEALVSGDRALLALAGRTPFPILSPAALRRRVES
jgi:predicted nucleic acid-binding protein